MVTNLIATVLDSLTQTPPFVFTRLPLGGPWQTFPHPETVPGPKGGRSEVSCV